MEPRLQGRTSNFQRSYIKCSAPALSGWSPHVIRPDRFGVITSADDVFKLLRGGLRRSSGDGHSAFENCVEPAVYAYVIAEEDETFRFSETGARFFVDCASKRALHKQLCSKRSIQRRVSHSPRRWLGELELLRLHGR